MGAEDQTEQANTVPMFHFSHGNAAKPDDACAQKARYRISGSERSFQQRPAA
jgi:hypothetical protein